jgi:hypothetical protein
MRVSQTLTMAKYDALTRDTLTRKLPVWTHRDWRRRVGDSIYNFEADPPVQRAGVHAEGNLGTDLSGLHVLLSDHFFYFGDLPQPLPDHLLGIVQQGQGHKSVSNQPFVNAFVSWIEGLGFKANSLHGKPQLNLFEDETTAATCAESRQAEALEDERLAQLNSGDH